MSLWLGLTHRVSLVLSQSLPKQKWCSGQVNYSRWPGLMYRITRNKWQDCASLEWRVRLWIRTDEMYVWMLLWSVGLAQCFWWQLYLFGSIGLKGYKHLLLLWFFFLPLGDLAHYSVKCLDLLFCEQTVWTSFNKTTKSPLCSCLLHVMQIWS